MPSCLELMTGLMPSLSHANATSSLVQTELYEFPFLFFRFFFLSLQLQKPDHGTFMHCQSLNKLLAPDLLYESAVSAVLSFLRHGLIMKLWLLDAMTMLFCLSLLSGGIGIRYFD